MPSSGPRDWPAGAPRVAGRGLGRRLRADEMTARRPGLSRSMRVQVEGGQGGGGEGSRGQGVAQRGDGRRPGVEAGAPDGSVRDWARDSKIDMIEVLRCRALRWPARTRPGRLGSRRASSPAGQRRALRTRPAACQRGPLRRARRAAAAGPSRLRRMTMSMGRLTVVPALDRGRAAGQPVAKALAELAEVLRPARSGSPRSIRSWPTRRRSASATTWRWPSRPTASSCGPPGRAAAVRRLRGAGHHQGRRQRAGPPPARRAQGIVRADGRRGGADRDGVRRHHPDRPARRLAGAGGRGGGGDAARSIVGSGAAAVEADLAGDGRWPACPARWSWTASAASSPGARRPAAGPPPPDLVRTACPAADRQAAAGPAARPEPGARRTTQRPGRPRAE